MSLVIQGKYNQAKIFTDIIEESAIDQISNMLNQPFIEGESVRIMPDVHAGKGATIGTTMTIHNGKVVPNLVGVDIGCGICVYKIENVSTNDWQKLDAVIVDNIPSGRSTHNKLLYDRFNLNDLSFEPTEVDRIQLSKGTLGGGNHFIEVSSINDEYYLLIHSGSRNLGVQVAKYHQNQAIHYHKSNIYDRTELINRLKSEGREQDIQLELAQLKSNTFDKDLAYLESSLLATYLNDMNIAQHFAVENRATMAEIIIDKMGWTSSSFFDSIHNYIDLANGILRKGATDASKGTELIIPLNMRDGAIIATGKGNKDWNYSAPHGAGRVMSRTKAKESLSIEDFKETMKEVYSTSVSEKTLDEAPFAYKESHQILDNIRDTVEIKKIVKPVYNYKAH